MSGRPRPIRVVVVEDGAVARELLVRLLTDAGDFEVVDVVTDGQDAVDRIVAAWPDVVTMDMRLPGIDGFEVTRRVMRIAPIPIVIVSSSSNVDRRMVFEALRAGALAVVKRPTTPSDPDFEQRCGRLLTELRSLASVRVLPRADAGADRGPSAEPIAERLAASPVELVAVGASTGGPAALRTLLSGLPPKGVPPIVIVQHIGRGFVDGLAEWLSVTTGRPIRVARGGEPLGPGGIFLAPDDRHLIVTPERRLGLRDWPLVDGHRPSATVLFGSVATTYEASGMGVILTGMGRDGAAGLLAIRRAGGVTLGQDVASSVVHGMPGTAAEAGAVQRLLHIDRMAAAIARELSNGQPDDADAGSRRSRRDERGIVAEERGRR
jgi:two-component system chemotaxis response regulator CheB